MDQVLLRLLIGALAYFILDQLFGLVFNDANVKRIFDIILIFLVVIYVFFGYFLPR